MISKVRSYGDHARLGGPGYRLSFDDGTLAVTAPRTQGGLRDLG